MITLFANKCKRTGFSNFAGHFIHCSSDKYHLKMSVSLMGIVHI